MTSLTDMLKTSEAAMVAEVTVREVNRVIDEGILPTAHFSVDRHRTVSPAACVLISFYFESARRLTQEERKRAIRQTAPKLRTWRRDAYAVPATLTVQDDLLTIDMKPFAERAAGRLAHLDAARAAISISPDILNGAPVFKGTRVPVQDVAASLAAGQSAARVSHAYPSVDPALIELATIYMAANPVRGRPRAISADAIPLSSRRVKRRATAA